MFLYILNYLISPYSTYSYFYIFLESTAMLLGISSVYFSYKKNILFYPTGILSTFIYTYLLFKWQLYGDMIINAYYVVASFVGWVYWSKNLVKAGSNIVSISPLTREAKKISLYIFTASIFFLILVYFYFLFDKGSILIWPYYAYVDILTSALAFTAMYLINKRHIESWYFWIAVNILSVMLYIYKGYGITALQYFIFLNISILGLRSWRKYSSEGKV